MHSDRWNVSPKEALFTKKLTFNSPEPIAHGPTYLIKIWIKTLWLDKTSNMNSNRSCLFKSRVVFLFKVSILISCKYNLVKTQSRQFMPKVLQIQIQQISTWGQFRLKNALLKICPPKAGVNAVKLKHPTFVSWLAKDKIHKYFVYVCRSSKTLQFRKD